MEELRLFLALRHAFFLAGPFILVAAAAAPTTTLNLLGVAPQDVGYYRSGHIIWCKDGSKSFSAERLNDDFCDCPDATDEPGTSACPNGRFFCNNQRQKPLWVFSSRVNDGICDCCDGSDEYDGKVQCKSACPVDTGDMLIQSLPRKAAYIKDSLKEIAMTSRKYRRKSSLWKEEEKELTDTASKPKYLKMLVVLEIVLVMMALRQFYVWTCQGGLGPRRRLPR
eukprot:c5413_g1_i1 orf=157-828(-)